MTRATRIAVLLFTLGTATFWRLPGALAGTSPLFGPGDIIVADTGSAGASGAIIRVDPLSGAQTIVAQGDNVVLPYFLVTASNGDVIVADCGGAVVRIDRFTGAQSVISSGNYIGCAYGIALGADGDIFVSIYDSKQIVRVDPHDGGQTLVPIQQPFVTLEGIGAAPNGDLYAVDPGTHGLTSGDQRIVRIDPATGAETVVAQAGLLVFPRVVLVEPSGHLLVTDGDAFGNQGAIIDIDPATGEQVAVSHDAQFGNPHGTAIEPAGTLVTTDPGAFAVLGDERVFRVDPATGAATVLSSNGSLSLPWGIVVIGAPTCGNGTRDPGEQCDDGDANGTSTSCCTTACVYEVEGAACSDGNLCDGPDTCQAGRCMPETTESSLDCDDHNACTTDRCDPAAGCQHTPVADGTTCNDGSACTRTDVCRDGTCLGENSVVCAAPDQCHEQGVCDAASGQCLFASVRDGAPCDDGDPCTQGDACRGGTCRTGTESACIRTPPPDGSPTVTVERPASAADTTAVVTAAGYVAAGTALPRAATLETTAPIRPAAKQRSPCDVTAPAASLRVTKCIGHQPFKKGRTSLQLHLRLNATGRKLLRQQGELDVQVTGDVTDKRGNRSLIGTLLRLLRR